MTNMDVSSPLPRSTFVTVTAWIFIALSGLAVLISILQNIIFAFIASNSEFQQAFEQQENVPEFMRFFLDNIQLILFVSLLLIILLLASSIGLLVRKNWARKTFIVYMFILGVYMIVGSALQQYWMAEMMPAFDDQNAPPQGFQDIFEAMQYIILIFNVGLGVVFCWIGWKLMKPAIKEEFVTP